MSPRPCHVNALACEPNSTSPRDRRVPRVADRPIDPYVVQRRSPSHEPELARDPLPKTRSRRCFVCGTMGRHPLDFRVCPRTAVLLRRSLAKFNDDGHLVLFDGSPLPMTRHPGGVAAHIISRIRNPTRAVPERLQSPPAPRITHIPPKPVPAAPRVPSPLPTFNSSSPHAIPPLHRVAPEPGHVPMRGSAPSRDHAPHLNDALSRARASFLTVLLESLLNSAFRVQLHAIVRLVDYLHAEDPSTLRQRIQPVFTRISLFTSST
ncbi:hypothetical protein B0H10DRAFT_2441979 [Mycena sp. CBHHK59/15]|nr:hypothetical protein B0H10DRAFT_2441979 [Mycena sp. CBHHK59/15]